FDQSPMPMPLLPTRRTEAFIEAGFGNEASNGVAALPLLRGWFSQSLSPRTVLQMEANYHSFDKSVSAISNYASMHGKLGVQLGEDPAIYPFHSSALTLSAGYKAKSLSPDFKLDRSLNDLFGAASVIGDMSDRFHYTLATDIHNFSYNLNDAELSENISAAVH